MDLKRFLTFTAFFVIALVFQFTPTASDHQTVAASRCNWAAFVADVTIPDGSTFNAGTGQGFIKTWRLKNIGACTWSTAYSLVYVQGTNLSYLASQPLPKEVKPGETIDLSVPMQAPYLAGHYNSSWQLKAADGTLFGIGSSAADSFYVTINVIDNLTAGYDFAANACAATWRSGAGLLPCPSSYGDARGFVVRFDNPRLENGTVEAFPGLLVSPENKFNGYLQGTFPEITVQGDSRFQATVGCDYAAACYVTFRLDYQVDNGALKTFWTWSEKNEGNVYRVDKSLSSLAGRKVKFTLTFLAAGFATNDRAIWGHPLIVGAAGPGPTLTPTFTASPTPILMCTPPICQAGTGTLTCGNPNGCPGGCGTICATDTPTPSPIIMCTAPACSAGNALTCNSLDGCPGSCGLICAPFTLTPATIVTPTFSSTPVPVTVPPYEAPGTFYDFGVNACAASWKSGAGALPCPGTDGDSRGFVLPVSQPHYENGATDNSPSLILVPQNKYDGYLQGVYPEITIQAGDRFQSIVNCAYGASCYVTFRLDYQIENGPPVIFWSWKEKNEGQFYRTDLDLSKLAGKKVKFTLTLLATGPATGDRALWAQPRLIRLSTASPTPTPSLTPVPVLPRVDVAQPFSVACGMTNPMDVYGAISSNAAQTVTYHWELGGDKSEVSADQFLTFNSPGTIPLHAGAYQLDCGTYTASLVVTSPTYFSAKIYFKVAQTNSIFTSTPTPTLPDGITLTPALTATASVTPSPLPTASLTPTLTSTPTATSAALVGPYAVMLVAANDVLNVRSGPGTNYGIISSFAPTARDVWLTGAKTGGWVETQIPGGTGWVNAYYLTELVAPAAFCADSRVNTLLANLSAAIKTSNGTALAALVNPKHGLEMSLNIHNPSVNFSQALVSTLFTSLTSYDWGSAEGSGLELIGTFKDILQPKLLEVFNSSYLSGCNDATIPAGVGQPWLDTRVNFYSLKTPEVMPWRMFMVGIEYVDGKPYLYRLIHAQWAP